MGALRSAAAVTGALGVTAAAAAHVWARHVEVHRFTLREAELRILPPGTRTLRVLHISDIHLLPDQERKLAFLRHLESLRPHLVIDTGDNIAAAASVPVLAEAIGPLLRRPGAFVMGSNDMFAPMPKNPARYLLPDPRPADMTEPKEPTLSGSSPRPSPPTAGRTSPTRARASSWAASRCDWSGSTTRISSATRCLPCPRRSRPRRSTAPCCAWGSPMRPIGACWTPSRPTGRS